MPDQYIFVFVLTVSTQWQAVDNPFLTSTAWLFIRNLAQSSKLEFAILPQTTLATAQS